MGKRSRIHQCDMCGAPLWWLDVSEDVTPVSFDVEAFKMWETRTDDALLRDEVRRMSMTPAEWREDLRRAVNVENAITAWESECQRLIADAEDRLSVIRQANGEIDW
jgi:hypothetical protein